jgi:Calx-beta domain-containing protein
VSFAMLLGALVWGAPAASANTIGVGDVQVGEAAGTVVFNVTRNAGLLAGSATIDFRTVDGSATSGADYVAASGQVTFGAALLGATQNQQVVVSLRPDALDEDNESLRLVLAGREVVDDTATATIVDDDPPPVVSVADSPVVTEGAAGAQATFVVRLSPASGRQVSVAYATVNGAATAGQDYTARSGTLVLNAGTAQATIAVAVLDDGADEPAESFELRLSSPGSATIGDGAAIATISDDDEPPASPGSPAGGGVQQPSNPSIPLPTLGSTPGETTGSSTKPALGISSPRLKRPSTVLVTVSCPKGAGRCSGRITIFTIPNKRSKIKALRRERRLGRLSFGIVGGRAQTLELKLGRSDRSLLRRTGRLRVRAYALTQNAAGATGVRSVNGTLIARTAHSSPSRR